MSFVNHIAFGSLVTGTKLVLSKEPLTLGVAIATISGCLLPDIDNPSSFIGSKIKPISRLFANKFGHRTITHSFITLFVIYIVFALLEFLYDKKVYLSGLFALNYASHIVLDMFTRDGVESMYPLSRAKFVFIENRSYRLSGGDKKHEISLLLSLLFMNTFVWFFYKEDIKLLLTSKLQTIPGLHNIATSDSQETYVDYWYIQDSIEYKGYGIVVESSKSSVTIFDINLKEFHSIDSSSCSIKRLKPKKCSSRFNRVKTSKNQIDINALNALTKDKAILEISITSDRALTYKDNVYSKHIRLTKVYSPHFQLERVDDNSKELKRIQEEIHQIEQFASKTTNLEKELLMKQLRALKERKKYLLKEEVVPLANSIQVMMTTLSPTMPQEFQLS